MQFVNVSANSMKGIVVVVLTLYNRYPVHPNFVPPTLKKMILYLTHCSMYRCTITIFTVYRVVFNRGMGRVECPRRRPKKKDADKDSSSHVSCTGSDV